MDVSSYDMAVQAYEYALEVLRDTTEGGCRSLVGALAAEANRGSVRLSWGTLQVWLRGECGLWSDGAGHGVSSLVWILDAARGTNSSGSKDQEDSDDVVGLWGELQFMLALPGALDAWMAVIVGEEE